MTRMNNIYIFRKNQTNYIKKDTVNSHYLTNIFTKFQANRVYFKTVVTRHANLHTNGQDYTKNVSSFHEVSTDVSAIN